MTSLRHLAIGFVLLTVVVGAALWQATGDNFPAVLAGMANSYKGIQFNLAPLFEANWVIQIHVAAAMSALVLGAVQLAAPKGTLPHRTLGYVWAVLMVTTAISAIFIREINGGDFSFIHIFVPLTLLGLVGVIANARKMKTEKHRNAVLGLFFGALLLPGLFAFMPGRLMWQIVFSG
ncbi:DUF2306 domain-containing protein [Hyphobacterium marinum]|uniref:DUF2306 domain-containing protein n=1 Tax=Hyphobacterium marinum TaxID=3116574 RepID=A0ABU7LW60_9PROT|nr:DUF2306 domain-containing protein [Hyphobacterium sp. Y6023]MEE2565517.1 DUF2306 domain-containing protein [Hyphobacterium sp. Y6023]